MDRCHLSERDLPLAHDGPVKFVWVQSQINLFQPDVHWPPLWHGLPWPPTVHWSPCLWHPGLTDPGSWFLETQNVLTFFIYFVLILCQLPQLYTQAVDHQVPHTANQAAPSTTLPWPELWRRQGQGRDTSQVKWLSQHQSGRLSCKKRKTNKMKTWKIKLFI